eukprot:3675668-Rhodomonas_salina.2
MSTAHWFAAALITRTQHMCNRLRLVPADTATEPKRPGPFCRTHSRQESQCTDNREYRFHLQQLPLPRCRTRHTGRQSKLNPQWKSGPGSGTHGIQGQVPTRVYTCQRNTAQIRIDSWLWIRCMTS